MTKYKELSKEIHQQNLEAGWWDQYLDDKTRRYETAMMLVASELAEAMEGCRKELMDDKLPQYRMFDVELADALIRLLDLAGAYEIDLVSGSKHRAVAEMSNKTRPEQLWHVIRRIVETEVRYGYRAAIALGIDYILGITEVNSIEIDKIVEEKREFNRNRADHKKQNRKKKGGKKF